jgi:hypothetical protein
MIKQCFWKEVYQRFGYPSRQTRQAQREFRQATHLYDNITQNSWQVIVTVGKSPKTRFKVTVKIVARKRNIDRLAKSVAINPIKIAEARAIKIFVPFYPVI